MPENDLLSQFDAISVDNTQRISEKDRAFCEQQQKYFEKSLAQIRVWEKRLRKFLEEEPNPMFGISKYNDVDEKFFSHEWDAEQPDAAYLRHEFSPCYGLVACPKLALNLCETFESAIIRHFSQTYGCSFEKTHIIARAYFGDKLECKRYSSGSWSEPEFKRPGNDPLPDEDTPAPSFELVIDDIVESLGGMSFAQKEKKEIYDKLGKKLTWEPVTRSGKKVKIGWIAEPSWDGSRFHDYSTHDNVMTVLDAVKILFDYPFKACVNLSAERFGTDYGVWNSPVQAVKPYKNRSMDFVFATTEQATQFFELCEKLKEEQKNKK